MNIYTFILYISKGVFELIKCKMTYDRGWITQCLYQVVIIIENIANVIVETLQNIEYLNIYANNPWFSA